MGIPDVSTTNHPLRRKFVNILMNDDDISGFQLKFQLEFEVQCVPRLDFLDSVVRAKCKSVEGLGAMPPEADDII